MAFHPFRHFRKHQKVFFAIMLMVCMITFVFSGFGSSGADPFQNILRWIGMSRTSGEEVLPLYGKTIRTDDLNKTMMQRQLASEFLKFGIISSNALDSIINDIQKKIERERKASPDNLPTPMQMAYQEWNMARIMAQFGTPADRQKQAFDSLQKVQTQLANAESQKNAEQARAIDALMSALAFQTWLLSPQRQPKEYYFGGTDRPEELLDFLVWKHQADKLGIVLTSADICREVNRAWGNGDFLKSDSKFANNEWVNKFFASNQAIHKRLGASDLLSALIDEYRVAFAKEAILGSGSGVRFYRGAVDGIHHSPAAATPDEFLKYFQEQRTTVAVSMLPLSVESFVPKVQAKPSEDDLRSLFARYEKDEPSPARRQPGFKEPRRIKVQYFSYRPDGPFAKKLAAKATELLPLFRVSAPAAPLPAGGGAAWAANLGGLAVSTDLDAALRTHYDEYLKDESSRILKYDKDDDRSFGSRFGHGFDVFDRHGAEARPAMAYLGQVLGAGGAGGTMLSAPIAWLSTYELHERATACAAASTVLAGFSPSPLVAATLPLRYFHATKPLSAVRGQMIERFEKALAGRAMADNIRKMRVELDKQLNSHSEQKVAEYLKKAVADYGLENYHSMTALQTRQEMRDHPDAALKDLRTAYDKSKDIPSPQQDRQSPDFAAAMFQFFPPMQRDKEAVPVQSQQFSSDSGEEMWVYWRVEDKPAHTQKFEAVRADVEKAWYFEQAHKLAREEARRINEDLRKKHYNNVDDALRDLRETKRGEVFQLANVAHLVPKILLVGSKYRPDDFLDYQPPKDKIAYPPADFVAQLLKLKKPGESLVLADQPVKHFYVAVLMVTPQPPDLRQFYDIYDFTGPNGNPLWLKMMNARRQTYYQKLMEQLRAEATPKLEGGEYIIPESVRSRGQSSGDSGE